MITLCYRRLHLVESCLSFFLLAGFEEANCHQSYNLREQNAVNKHMSREVAAPLVEILDENAAPVTILRAAPRDPM